MNQTILNFILSLLFGAVSIVLAIMFVGFVFSTFTESEPPAHQQLAELIEYTACGGFYGTQKNCSDTREARALFVNPKNGGGNDYLVFFNSQSKSFLGYTYEVTTELPAICTVIRQSTEQPRCTHINSSPNRISLYALDQEDISIQESARENEDKLYISLDEDSNSPGIFIHKQGTDVHLIQLT